MLAPHSHRALAAAAPLQCGCRHRPPLPRRPRGRAEPPPSAPPQPGAERSGHSCGHGRAAASAQLRGSGLQQMHLLIFVNRSSCASRASPNEGQGNCAACPPGTLTACPTHALLGNHMHLLVCNSLKLRSAGRSRTQLGYKSLITACARISELHSNLPQDPTETQGTWPLPSPRLVCMAQECCRLTFTH